MSQIPSIQTQHLALSHYSPQVSHLPSPCTGTIAIGVVSTPGQRTRRIAIRNTWGQWARGNITWGGGGKKLSKNMKRFLEKKNLFKEEVEHRSYSVSLFFTVGRIKSEEDRMFLQQEAEEYRDILITNNKEGYSNLPLKTIAMIDYFTHHCHNASYLLKMDDDVFLTVPLLAKTIDELSLSNFTIGGRLTTMESPDRTAGYKYYISEHQYAGKHYPPFLSGISTSS